MKTPIYTRNADKAWRARMKKLGWQDWRVFAPATLVEQLKNYYKKLKGDL